MVNFQNASLSGERAAPSNTSAGNPKNTKVEKEVEKVSSLMSGLKTDLGKTPPLRPSGGVKPTAGTQSTSLIGNSRRGSSDSKQQPQVSSTPLASPAPPYVQGRPLPIPPTSAGQRTSDSGARKIGSPPQISSIKPAPAGSPLAKKAEISSLQTSEVEEKSPLSVQDQGEAFLLQNDLIQALDFYTADYRDEIVKAVDMRLKIEDIRLNVILPQKPFSTSSQLEVAFLEDAKPKWLTPTPEDEARPKTSSQRPQTFQDLPSPFIEEGDKLLAAKSYDRAVEAYTKGLQNAEESNHPLMIAACLKQISTIYFERKDYKMAARILAGSLAIYLSNQPTHPAIAVIYEKMAEVEKRFAVETCQVGKEQANRCIDSRQYSIRKQRLLQLRNLASQQIQVRENAEKILSGFSEGIQKFCQDLASECIQMLGKPPCAWAMIGLGSLARKEMSPSSDLEFALLLETDQPSHRDYFRKLVRLMEVKVILLGETPIKILSKGQVSPTPRGFSYDDGGNTPLGKEGQVELIGEPEKMAGFQSEKFYEEDLILSSVLRTACFLAGEEKLHKVYESSVAKVVAAKCPQTKMLIREKRALEMLKNHLNDFAPRLGAFKEDNPNFNIKAELYRLPNMLITTLADFFGLEEKNTWERIGALEKKGYFNREAAKTLSRVMSDIMTLRVRSHLFYEAENDTVFHPSMQRKNPFPLVGGERLFYLSQADVEKMEEIYQVILPLYRNFKNLSEAGNLQPSAKENFFKGHVYRLLRLTPKTKKFQELSKEDFYDKPLTMQAGQQNLVEHNYKKAQEIYEQAVALNPDDYGRTFNLGNVHYEQGNYSDARSYLEKAVAIARLTKDNDHLCDSLDLLGDACFKLFDYPSAIKNYSEVLRVGSQHYHDKPGKRAFYLSNLAHIYRDLGHAEKAVACFRKVIEIALDAYGSTPIARCVNNLGAEMASHYHNLGCALREAGDPRKAISALKSAVIIDSETDRLFHPAHAVHVNTMGLCYLDIGDSGKALELFKESIEIRGNVYGIEHPDSAITQRNLGSALNALGFSRHAIKHQEDALKTLKKFFGERHPEVAECLLSLGKSREDMGDVQKAAELYEEALTIHRQIYDSNHPKILIDLNHLGGIWVLRGDIYKASAYLNEALSSSQVTPITAQTLDILGKLLASNQQYLDAEKKYNQALMLYSGFYGSESAKCAEVLGSLSDAASKRKDLALATDYCQRQIGTLRKTFESPHASLARAYFDLANIMLLSDNREGVAANLQEAWNILMKCPSNGNTLKAFCRFNLGMTCLQVGMLDNAVNAFEEAIEILEDACTKDYHGLASMYNMLGQVRERTKKPKEAAGCYQNALRIRRLSAKKDDSDAGLYLNNLGSALKSLGKIREAIPLYEEALKIAIVNYGEVYTSVATRHFNLGNAFRELKMVDKMIHHLEEALRIDGLALGENHPELTTDLHALGTAYDEAKMYPKAEACFVRLVNLLKLYVEPTHPKIKDARKTLEAIQKKTKKSQK